MVGGTDLGHFGMSNLSPNKIGSDVLRLGSVMKERDEKTGVAGISWNDRFKNVLVRYSRIETICPELIGEIVVGLDLWSQILPQVAKDVDGYYLPANSWGLGPEKTEIYALVDELILRNRHDLSESLRKKFDALCETAESLDARYPKETAADDEAETRLVSLCRRQTLQLRNFLMRLTKVMFGSQSQRSARSHGASRVYIEPGQVGRAGQPRRSQRALNIERLEKELIEHIKAARDYAWAAVSEGRHPTLLARPLKRQLAKLRGLEPWTVSRCFDDPQAKQLRLLWDVAADLEQIMRFTRK